jgi:hypothetical protein
LVLFWLLFVVVFTLALPASEASVVRRLVELAPSWHPSGQTGLGVGQDFSAFARASVFL